MPASPKATVEAKFKDRSKLVDQLADMVDDLHDDGKAGVRSRLAGLSNKKLLRLYKIEQAVRERYGDREKLIEAIVATRKKAGLTANDHYRESISGYSKGRLLDLTRHKPGDAATKQTPEQRLKSKRGRKQRERAQSKLSG